MTSGKDEYEALLDRRIRRIEHVAGGDIGESVRLECEDGSVYFAKRYPGGASDMAEAEAAGLDWLARARALRVPNVIATGPGPSPRIVLEWIDQAPPAPHFDELLGRGLAKLHASGAPNFGWARDNFIGSLPQANATHTRWSDFYAHQRIEPQVERARRAGLIPNDLDRALSRLIDTMDSLCGPEVEPARLHGDLWAGNVMADERGDPCLFDPAVYGGHREMDLGMMRLFGGFGPRAFDAYREANPLPEGHDERVPLWQLYPLLVHVNLFGGGYVNSVAAIVRRLV